MTTDPTGIHTCQTGRATTTSWFTYGTTWNCPFCGDHGPDHTGPINPWEPGRYHAGILNPPQDTP